MWRYTVTSHQGFTVESEETFDTFVEALDHTIRRLVEMKGENPSLVVEPDHSATSDEYCIGVLVYPTTDPADVEEYTVSIVNEGGDE